ncbi:MAG: DJ-1/PfpI family protein [Candidatus Neomarinimicrobiota bacterium]
MNKTRLRLIFTELTIGFVIVSISGMLFAAPKITARQPQQLTFACMAYPGSGEIEVITWARSIRDFGGRYKNCPIWVLIPGQVEEMTLPTRQRLQTLGVRLIPFMARPEALRFPLATKVYAAAVAESLAVGNTAILVWMDSDNILFQEPTAFDLPVGKSFGYRPVQVVLIGSRYDQPVDDFWDLIYRECTTPPERIFPLKTYVDEVPLRAYFNAGLLVMRPELKILQTWRTNFDRLFLRADFQPFYRKSRTYAIFVHQAILSGTILAMIDSAAMIDFPSDYNYPLNLIEKIPPARRFKDLSKLVTVRYDDFGQNFKWRGLINIKEPLKTWLEEPLVFKGIDVLALMSPNVGAGFWMNRDYFEQFGWNVTLTGVADTLPVCPYYRDVHQVPPLVPDLKFPEIVDLNSWNALAIMPASSYQAIEPFQEIINDGSALALVKQAVTRGMPVSAICAGGRLLAAADVIRGKKVLGQPKFKSEYINAGAIFMGNDQPPISDGNLLTAVRDQYYSYSNCQALGGLIENRQPCGKPKRVPADQFIFEAEAGFQDQSLQWSKVIGGFGADAGRAVISTADGGLLTVGYTFSHGSRDADILVVRTDSLGNLDWSRTYGGSGTEYGFCCTAVKGGYLVAGYTTSFGNGARDVFIVRLNEAGETVWTKTYGGPRNDVGLAVCEAPDGYLICGSTDSYGAGEEDVFLIRTDFDGRQKWTQTYGGLRYEIGNSVWVTATDEIYIGGTTGTFGGRNSDFWLVKTDGNGRQIWAKNYGTQMQNKLNDPKTPTFDWCSQAQPTSDGGAVMVGFTNSRDIMDILVIKVDTDGQQVWAQTCQGGSFYDYGYAVMEMPDSGFVVCGTTKNIQGDNDVYLTKIDSGGRLVWEKTIGHRYSDWGSGICLTGANELIITGHTASAGFGTYDLALWKIKTNF